MSFTPSSWPRKRSLPAPVRSCCVCARARDSVARSCVCALSAGAFCRFRSELASGRRADSSRSVAAAICEADALPFSFSSVTRASATVTFPAASSRFSCAAATRSAAAATWLAERSAASPASRDAAATASMRVSVFPVAASTTRDSRCTSGAVTACPLSPCPAACPTAPADPRGACRAPSQAPTPSSWRPTAPSPGSRRLGGGVRGLPGGRQRLLRWLPRERVPQCGGRQLPGHLQRLVLRLAVHHQQHREQCHRGPRRPRRVPISPRETAGALHQVHLRQRHVVGGALHRPAVVQLQPEPPPPVP